MMWLLQKLKIPNEWHVRYWRGYNRLQRTVHTLTLTNEAKNNFPPQLTIPSRKKSFLSNTGMLHCHPHVLRFYGPALISQERTKWSHMYDRSSSLEHLSTLKHASQTLLLIDIYII